MERAWINMSGCPNTPYHNLLLQMHVNMLKMCEEVNHCSIGDTPRRSWTGLIMAHSLPLRDCTHTVTLLSNERQLGRSHCRSNIFHWTDRNALAND